MKINKISRAFRNIREAERWSVTASLDIHDDSTYLFSVQQETGEILKDLNLRGSYKKALKHLGHLGQKASVLILLEAGPHGFAPYRYFQRQGYAVKMIAPSSIPHSGDKQKTDRDDAIDNLNYHLSGKLRYVAVPDEEDECARECLRSRHQSVCLVTKEKQKIIALMKRLGQIFEGTKSNWTKAHYQWLKKVALHPCARQVLNMRLSRLETLERDVVQLTDTVLAYIAQRPGYAKLSQMYQYFSGIGTVRAAVLILEGRDLNRFTHPLAVMKFTGLIPGKHQSGRKDPALRITKAGNKYIRTAVVGAAAFFKDYRFLRSAAAMKAYPEILREFMTRCQDRLHMRYRYLMNKGKHSNKVKTAVAREFCGFLWEFAIKIVPTLNLEENKQAA
jgi:transposase